MQSKIKIQIPSIKGKSWEPEQHPIEDIREGIRVMNERGKAPDRVVFVVSEEMAERIEKLKSCDLVRIISNSGIAGGIAGSRLREAIQKAAKAMSEFGLTMVDAETFTEAVNKLHDFSLPVPSCKTACYKPSQFPLRKRKKDIYKKL
ncbi:MAG: hypothetical protein ABUK08_00285 [Candidatus Humimicrobiaceae bacterium]